MFAPGTGRYLIYSEHKAVVSYRIFNIMLSKRTQIYLICTVLYVQYCTVNLATEFLHSK
jgi:hypothetical protein